MRESSTRSWSRRRLRPKLPAGVGSRGGGGRAGRDHPASGGADRSPGACRGGRPERACAAAGRAASWTPNGGPLCHFAADLHGSLERYEKLFAGVDARAAGGALPRRRPAARIRRRGRTAVGTATSCRRPGAPPGSPAQRDGAGPDRGSSRSSATTTRERGGGDARARARGLLDYVHGAPRVPRPRRLRLRLRAADAVPAQGLGALRRVALSRSRLRLARGGVADGRRCRRARSAAGRSPATSPSSPGDADLAAGDLPLPRAAVRDGARPRRARRRMVDHVPLDVHVGSIAIRRFIEARQPLAALHGHVHESARLTGAWREPPRPHGLPLRRRTTAPSWRCALRRSSARRAATARAALIRPARTIRASGERAGGVGDRADLGREARRRARCPRR